MSGVTNARVGLVPAEKLTLARVEKEGRLERALLSLGRRLARGEIEVVLPNGNHYRFRAYETGPRAKLHIHRWRFARRLMFGGTLGFAEAYMDGDCDCDDVAAFLTLAAENEEALLAALSGHPVARLAKRAVHLMRPNTRRGAKRNIAAHYDLGNDFYAAWLDPSMTYSSAVYPRSGESLEEAQREKYRRLAEAVDLRPGHRVLEIGCGWGGFAEFAAKEIGAKVTGITISRAQHAYATARIADAGLSDRAEIRLEDYRDTRGAFDRIVSIEMFEAVGEKYWPVFFRSLRERLVDGGKAGLQIITISDRLFPVYRKSADFIQRYVFPGGMLPSPSALQREAGSAGLEWRDARSYGESYARTLAEWRQRFLAAWPHLEPGAFDEHFRRLWTYYLAYCEAGFRTGRIDVQQVVLARS